METNGKGSDLPAKDELLQKIGRNLILFQRIEHVLNSLLKNLGFSFPEVSPN